MLKFQSNSKGMTLIELLGVIVIIGILFVVLNAAINSSQESAKVAGAQTDLRSMQGGVEYIQKLTSRVPTATQLSENSDFEFHMDNGQGFFDGSTLTPNADTGEYIVDSENDTYVSFSDRLDPWNRPYVFVREGHTKLMLVSAGPDGKLQENPLTDAGDDVVLVFYNN